MALNYHDAFPEHVQILYHMQTRVASGELTPDQLETLKPYMESDYLRKVMSFSHMDWCHAQDFYAAGPLPFRQFVDGAIQAILSKGNGGEY